MSFVYITFHNENIFDVEKNFSTKRSLPGKRYSSKFKKSVKMQNNKQTVIDTESGLKLLTDSNKYKNRTMGCAELPLNPPCKFLKKNQGVKWRRIPQHKCVQIEKSAPIPKAIRPPPKEAVEKHEHEEKQRNVKGKAKVVGIPHKHRENFVHLNIERMKTAKVRKPPPRYVDTPHGDRYFLKNTGLVPQYICRKTYGKTPLYLQAQKEFLARLRSICKTKKGFAEDECLIPAEPEATVEIGMGETSGIQAMPMEEKQEILNGLKENFETLTKQYQAMSLYTDTVPKKQRKNKLEKELRQLEQDIFLMEANHTIYVSKY